MSKQSQHDVFITVDFNDKKESSEIRKRIRSRAAHHSHKVGRKSHKQETTSSTSTSTLSSPTTLHVTPQASQRLQITRQASIVELLRPVDNGFLFPVPEMQFYRSTMYYMWHWMQDAWQYLETTEPERREALIWVQRLTMSNAAYFYMNMLSCCSTLVDRGMLPSEVIPWLMTQTVRAINEALDDVQESLDIGVILAVGRIALRECMRGNYEVGTKVHRPAQAKILAMAGGMDALQIPMLVRKHLSWAERLVIQRTGVSLSVLHPGAITAEYNGNKPVSDETVLKRYYLTG